ncbi:MAG TPA: hydroxymethylbilane synthase [Methylomirabilota bacterium]|nr:hydroxymethylbilane synthase [Methylomirabilota bacterium]
MTERLRIGSRGSPLAIRQAELVSELLSSAWPSLRLEIVPIKTSGDRLAQVALADLGGKGLFVKEIEEALVGGGVDCAVHSLKDLPVTLPEPLTLSAFPPRDDPRDVLIGRARGDLKALPSNARVGTSSLRRRVQLLSIRPDLQIEPLRGNIDTRLRKLNDLSLDAIVLAAAGLKRLGLDPETAHWLSPDEFVPAIGQGILAIEARAEDKRVNALLGPLDHALTRCEALAERSFLSAIGGSCHTPLAGHARVVEQELRLTGLVGTLDGQQLLRDQVSGPLDQAAALGAQLAEQLLGRGADKLMKATQ